MAIDYVLAACCGYPGKVYERFVGSLYDSGYTGAAVLFVAEADLPAVAPVAARVLRGLAQGATSLKAAAPGDPMAFLTLLRRVMPLPSADTPPPRQSSPIILP